MTPPARPVLDILRVLRAPLVVALLLLTLAALARHRLVEPAGLTALCDAAPWQQPVCVWRSLTVQVFTQHRLGGVALICALVALATRWRWAAWAALALGSAGLMLYSVPLAAPALLLGLLVLARPGAFSRPAATPPR